MIEYCRRDTEITGRFVESMMNTYEKIGCSLKTTIAATTLAYFENNFYGRKIVHGFSEEQIDFFHRGYYGGRTEIYHNAPIEGQIWYHDLNSLYASCMKENPYPNLEHFYETNKPDYSLYGMADVCIRSPSRAIPYLPCRYEGRLVFPTGTFRGVYTYFELRQALQLGYEIGKCFRAIEFPSGTQPFSEFITCIYSERLKAQIQKDELMSSVYKAFGNFAYGKYAQKNESTQLIPTIELKKIENGTVILGGELALVKKKIKYPRYANCIWACYTTAYARHVLFYQGLRRVEESGGMLLYCDTDSVIYESPKQILEHSKDLGKFKLEGKYRYAHFKLPKLYRLVPAPSDIGPEPEYYRSKGVPRASAKQYFDDGKASYRKPNKLRGTLRRNLSPKRKFKLIPNYWEVQEKEIVGKYEKRIVLNNGETIPLKIGV